MKQSITASINGLLLNKMIIALTIILSVFMLSISAPVSASGHWTVEDCESVPVAERGVCAANPNAFFSDREGSGVYGVIESVIDLFSIVVGIISVIMIIIGGLKYVTSTGDAQKVDSAKNTILYAIIGLVIVAFAQVIVLFVLSEI